MKKSSAAELLEPIRRHWPQVRARLKTSKRFRLFRGAENDAQVIDTILVDVNSAVDKVLEKHYVDAKRPRWRDVEAQAARMSPKRGTLLRELCIAHDAIEQLRRKLHDDYDDVVATHLLWMAEALAPLLSAPTLRTRILGNLGDARSKAAAAREARKREGQPLLNQRVLHAQASLRAGVKMKSVAIRLALEAYPLLASENRQKVEAQVRRRL